jgi:CheY-like chemotaxis protein
MRLQDGRTDRVEILIAEDDAAARQQLRLLLEREGYRCAEAGNGRQAVELARQHPPACVLLDLAMPGLDGFGVARRLRADPRTHSTYIHCLTGLAAPAARAEAARAGCDRFLTKPVDVTALLHILREDLRRPTEWARGLTKAEAEELLDWLEAQGAAGELSYEEGGGFAVRCPGFRAEKDASGRTLLYRPADPTRP